MSFIIGPREKTTRDACGMRLGHCGSWQMRYVEAMDGRLSALYSIRKYVGQILLYDGSPGGKQRENGHIQLGHVEFPHGTQR